MNKELKTSKRRKILIIISMGIITLGLSVFCLFVGSSNMSFEESLKALFNQSTNANNRIMWQIRMPRALACIIAGAGLSLSGLIMQTTLGNQMASPSTLGVSNAAVFGANLSMILFAGGYISSGSNVNNYFSNINPFQISVFAFIFALGSTFLILALCKIRSFSPGTVVLAGIAIGSIWTAGTTFLQYFATDIGLTASVLWSFGDLSRATYETDLIMLIVVFVGSVFFIIISWKLNAVLNGDVVAKSMGVNVDLLRFLSLLIASLITAVCVSFLGIIGFVGIICPHIMKRLLGNDHRFLIPSSILSGAILLLFSDTLSRTLGNGSSLPVGAITSLLGAPFFLYIIFAKKENSRC